MRTEKKRKQVSLQDLADHVGLTLGTVSRALNDNPVVKQTTRERVKLAAAQIGYSPNLLARGLSSGRSGFIGVSFGQFRNLIHSVYLMRLLKLLDAHGKRALIEVGGPGTDKELYTLRHFASMRVDGVLLVGSSAKTDDSILQPLQDNGIPYVILDIGGSPPFDGQPLPGAICIDRRKGYRAITDYLIDLGHRNLALLGISREAASYQIRHEGIHDAMRKIGISPAEHLTILAPLYHHNESAFDYGCRTAAIALENHPEATAYLASNDEVATGALHYLLGRGIRVPDDISIVGFDNLAFSAFTTPSITTIDQNAEKSIELAVSALMQCIRCGLATPETSLLVEPDLCIRQSTGRAANSD